MEGIKAAVQLGPRAFEVEVDAMLLDAALKTNSFELAQMGGIILEIKNLINFSFVSCSVSFCPRVCNRVAHALAEKGCNSARVSDLSWDRLMQGIEQLVASDIAEPLS
uniref:RNase H type-1 domain-containing protein n=1 Tax=Leersia perrieri TaxID=77586 RepID=A0A0D9VE48_9ORYZ